MPQLQEHMLRVAGVASIICDNINIKIDKERIVKALLVHDMGNMSKIKLDRFPETAEPEGMEYWQKILDDFRSTYGDNDYDATYKILNELKLPEEMQKLVKSIEFANMTVIARENSIETKICIYSDARVAPTGVVSLNERLSEVKDRYIKNKGVSEEFFKNLSKSAFQIEIQIFENCSIKPNNITEDKVKNIFEELKKIIIN